MGLRVVVACPSCASESPATAKFCAECGTPMRRPTCPVCGSSGQQGRFCSDCGTSLRAPEGLRVVERRLTSVLFADLVGFTAWSEPRDPEQVRELLSRYFEAARTVVQRYGGTVEKFIGDAVMAVWGVPVAHEDGAERCVRAGLDLVDAVAALGEEVGAELAVRVGIVSGEVAVTLGLAGEGMVAGDAVNTAARVQAIATPGTVWVDGTTRALTAAAVEYVDEGEIPLRGKASVVRLFRARRVVAAVGGAQRVDGLEAPFTGRDRELRLVKELFHATVEDRRPRLVLVSGAAGSGKSRLGWEFEKHIDGLQGLVRWHRGRCLAYGEGVSFWALSEMVRGRLELGEGVPAAEVEAGLEHGLAELVPEERERSWLRGRLGVLLGTESQGYVREDLFAAWTGFFERVADGQEAVVLVVEDLQVADEGLLDFLDHVLEAARFPVFVLGLGRPELLDRRPSLGTGRRRTTVHLDPLDDLRMAELIDGLVDGLPPAARVALVTRAEGIPLYAVETVRALVDADAVVPQGGRYVLAEPAEQLDLLAVGPPPSLQALIASRLDALPPDERALVQDAAVLGAMFTADALAELTGRDDLTPLLVSLVHKEILTVRQDPLSSDRGQYGFVQAVVRQVAYETLSRRVRKERHLAVAVQLEREPDPGAELSAVIAQHYLDAAAEGVPQDDDQAALLDRARDLLARAGRRALSLGAPGEATRHYRAALDLPGGEAARPELLEGLAGAALSNGDGDLAHDGAAEAVALHLLAGDELAAARAATIQGEALSQRQELNAAMALLSPLYDALDERPGAEAVVLGLAETLARTANYLGDRALARRYTERMLVLAEATADHVRLVAAMTTWAAIWIVEGSPTVGLAVLDRAVDVARRRQLPSVLVRPLLNASAFYAARDLSAAIDAATESLRLAEQVGDRLGAAWAAMNLAPALWTAGRWDELRPLLEGDGERPWLWAETTSRTIAHVVGQWLAAATGAPPLVPPDAVFEAAEGEELNTRAWGLTALALDESDPARASALSAEAVRLAVAGRGLDDDFAHHWVGAVEQAVAAQDLPAAEQLLRHVTDRPSGLLTPYVGAQLPRLQAAVLELSGQDAPDLLTTAIARLTAFGAPLPQGQAELALARVLRRAGRHDEAEQARVRAEQLFARLGAEAWRARALPRIPSMSPPT